jgi:pyruvate,water dikinase
MAREEYLARYGHRGPHEFEISVPRPAEEPGWLDRQLAQFRQSPVDTEALLAQQRGMFDAAWRRFSSRYPREEKAMRRRIAESARRARLREAARSEYVRDRWLVRSFALRAGTLSGLGDDIFFLMLDELLALLSGIKSAIQYIPARRRTYRRYRALPPYPPVIRGCFDPFRWAADPNRRSDLFNSSAPLPASTSGDGDTTIVTGSPGAAGRVEGVVRCLDTADDGDQLQEGEILVTVLTDIAWTPLFLRAAAVVTDVGAPLSHAAIVARELGIPAVVGCGDATMRLKTGDRVRVDGSQGTVEILCGAREATAQQ